ncbi:MAG: hypothetical protein ACM30H_01385 [Clostridia bacterium]
MTQPSSIVTQPAPTPPAREWFWRVLAGLMLVMAAWVAWVAYQIMPSAVVTPAAYDALSQARAHNVQQGVIRPAEPPMFAESKDSARLRLAESIQTPIETK